MTQSYLDIYPKDSYNRDTYTSMFTAINASWVNYEATWCPTTEEEVNKMKFSIIKKNKFVPLVGKWMQQGTHI